MKLILIICLFTTSIFAYETYPYEARERESLGTILYSIGAKRLWGSIGSVQKHVMINQIKSTHEFKDNEIIRLAKEDIRFKCNVILKGDILVIKRALITKKDRQELLRENPNCLNDKIVQLATKKVKTYASARDYLKKKTKQYKKKIILKEKTKAIKKVEVTNNESATKSPSNLSISTKLVRSHKINLKGEHRLSYISTRNSLDYKAEGEGTLNTVANSSMGIMYEHLQKETGKGVMANFSIALMAPDTNPNYSFDTQGFVSYEIGYNFNDKFMLASALKVSQNQYQVQRGELTNTNFSEFLIRSIYRTRFMKKDNLISLSAGGVQTNEDLRGYSLGLRSEVLVNKFSFSLFYDLKELYSEQSTLSQNLFGLSIGRLF